MAMADLHRELTADVESSLIGALHDRTKTGSAETPWGGPSPVAVEVGHLHCRPSAFGVVDVQDEQQRSIGQRGWTSIGHSDGVRHFITSCDATAGRGLIDRHRDLQVGVTLGCGWSGRDR